ncbi:MAG: SUMF1/EgtB/PvdO family nonheme iron enzyme [Ignavibacteriaceae bacterium]|nr:SUMF1/EgtB/PvdO family nonheme iron enzyme [Ignavibacteriaceae bacterium]
MVICSQDKPSSPPQGFVLAEGGTFMMGSEDGESSEKPVHKVTLNSFYIGKYEVTQGEFEALMNGEDFSYSKRGPNYPVHHIDYYSILAFCNKKSIKEGRTPCYTIDGKTDIEGANDWGSSLPVCDFKANGYRLPTEAEWEYAARGGKESKGYAWSGSNNADDVCWYKDNSEEKIQPVGTKKPNELGIYDMSGNIEEMVWDKFDDEFYENSPESNPVATDEYQQVVRGGSVILGAGNSTVYARGIDQTTEYIQIIGFRLVSSK